MIARRYCGEGFPDHWVEKVEKEMLTDTFWDMLVPNLGMSMFDMYEFDFEEESGKPTLESCHERIFAMYYISRESQNFFDAFYKNDEGILDGFFDYYR